MNSSLELDNEKLRHKLQDLRKTNLSLVTENHRLVEMLETVGSELRNSSSHIRNLEDSVESYRSKSQELSGVLTVFQSVSKSSEEDCEKLKQKYEECSHQLAESASLMQSQSVAIESLKREVGELKNLRMKTEAERYLALETAEKIQRSYEELQSKFKKTLSSSEEEADILHKERSQLREDLEGRCTEIKTLQEEIKNLRAEISVQKNVRRENEQRNTDLRSQMKNQSTKIEKLEQDLENHKRFKVKNGEMKTVMDQQRKRIASLEADIRGVHSKLSQLESLLQYSKKTSAKGKNSVQNDGTLASGASSKTDKNGGRNGADDSIDLEKLVAAESELLQLRGDVLRLAGSFAELSGKDLSGVLDTEEKDKGFAVGRQKENFENETLEVSVTALASIEKRLSNFESMNARLVSHIAKLNTQISELQKNGNEQTTKQERERQKRMQQITLLEKQLDDKVQEMASRTFELNSIKAEFERSKTDWETVQTELDEKRKECRQMASDMNRLKELHSEHCVELEGQIALVEKERGETKTRLEQTESRCRALQQSLSQTIDMSDALKDDLLTCRQLESMVLDMEKQAKEATERAEELEGTLSSLRTEFAVQLESARVVEDDYRARLEERNERVRFCEERLSRAEEQVQLNEGEITRLLTELNCSQVSLRDGAEKMEVVEHERNLLQSQVVELQQRLKRETSHLELSLDSAEEKLEQASEELAQRDRRIADLTQKYEDIRLEKARTEKLLSKLEESDRLRMELEMEEERMNGVSVKQKGEIEMLRVMLKEREAAIEDLQGRVVRAYKELQEKTKTDKHSFAEVEQLKAEAHTRDSQLAEAARNAESQDRELKSYRDQLESVRTALTQCKEELQRNRLDFEMLNEKLQEKEWDVQQKTTKVKQLEQRLDEHLSVLTESEHKRLRFEGALQKNQLDAEQYEKQVSGLEDQVHDLLALVKEQCLKIQKDEATNGQLSTELDGRNARIEELERSAGNLQQELKRMTNMNKRAEQELCASREHLQKMHNDLIGARQELVSLRCQHDHLAKDLAEAVALLQQKDSELTKLLETLSVAEEFRSRYSDQLEQSEEAYRSLKASYHRDLHHLKKVHEAAIAVRENENRSLQQDLVASNEQQRHLEKRVRLQMEHRESQHTESKRKHTEIMEVQGKERASSLLKNNSEIGVKTSANALELSRSTSKASLSDTSIFSNSQSSSNSEVALMKTHHSDRDHRQCLPHEGWSTSSGNHGPCTELDFRAVQCGLDQDEGLRNSQIPNQSYSNFAMQQCEDNNRLSNDFFQTMWKELLNSKVEEHPVSGYHPTRCAKQDESRVTMCTPVHASDHSASAVDHSALAVNHSAPVSNSSTLPVSHSDLVVYHLAPCGKRSTSSIDHSNSMQPQKDPYKSSRSKVHPQNPSKSQTPEPKPRQHQTPNPKKTDPVTNTAFSRSATKLSKNASKRSTRTLVNESPFSPIFANRHSPNPTTAISYYEKILPMSISDAEVEKIIAGRDFYDGERFSCLSDE